MNEKKCSVEFTEREMKDIRASLMLMNDFMKGDISFEEFLISGKSHSFFKEWQDRLDHDINKVNYLFATSKFES